MPSITLKASDGHELSAYMARPVHAPRAGLVVIQEIFGVNEHIRAVVDGFADQGYLAIAPALFDRVEPGIELTYEGDDFTRGRALRAKVPDEKAMLDLEAARQEVAHEVDREAGHIGVVGYCWGGSLAWLAACRLPFEAAVGYYGGQIADHLDETPRCPTILHFGEKDELIAPDAVQKIRDAHPEMAIFTYPAGHGFNCTSRADYHPESAELALERTLLFFEEKLAKAD